MTTLDDPIFTPEQLVRLTGYKHPSRQLAALHAQGFYRARRNALGAVVLERAHYDAVCAGGTGAGAKPERPPLLPLRRVA
ncbi:MAG: DUF4224 domain-containing protein [Dokdonella sp.]|uniref:DUF4224 domain-containing protein n=1 Tax=Dokdonella sp. TaxID=2291710 RepID=UPI003F81DB5B